VPVWDADVELSEELARRLIREQFAEVAADHLDLVGEGWDNVAYLVDGEWLFRFPRREIARTLLEHETRILPLLGPHVTLPIPNPELVGRTDDFPYPFAGYRYLAGTPACHLEWTDEQRSANARGVGCFLKSLHSVVVGDDASVWAPRDELRRSDLALRHSRNLGFIEEHADLLEGFDSEHLRAKSLQLSQALPYTGKECWVHGDLYPCHLLSDDQHQICGVIDWGDVHLGDPALDLSVAFTFLPKGSRAELIRAYGGTDEDTLLRAQLRAMHYGLLFLKYGSQAGKAEMLGLGYNILQLALDREA
jgi:aminoglycoside phosphotransferase (APT) family kinase protein